MSKVIGLVNRDKVVCVGNMRSCENYINQLYSINVRNVNFMEFDGNDSYDDYEVVYIPEEKIYMLMGSIKLLQNSCKEEQSTIKYMEDEIEKLKGSEIFKDHTELLSEMDYVKEVLNKMSKIQNKYINENVFYNLDLDGLHSAFIYERENKGEPICYTNYNFNNKCISL